MRLACLFLFAYIVAAGAYWMAFQPLSVWMFLLVGAVSAWSIIDRRMRRRRMPTNPWC